MELTIVKRLSLLRLPQRGLWIAGGVVVTCIAAAITLHSKSGASLFDSATHALPFFAKPTTPEVRKMIGRLEESSRQSNDPNVLLRLGQAYTATGRAKEASVAYRKAYEQAPKSPEVLAQYAWSLHSEDHQDSANGRRSAQPIYEELHKIDPNNVQALSYLGLAAIEKHNYQSALVHWETLLKTLPPNSPLLPDVRRAIVKTRLLASLSAGEQRPAKR